MTGEPHTSEAASAQYADRCETCGAEPFQPCRTLTSGEVTDTHRARLDAYEARLAARVEQLAAEDRADDPLEEPAAEPAVEIEP